MTKVLTFLTVAYLTQAATASTYEEFMFAIRWVETGGRNVTRIGDNGLSIGPYQISKAYWIASKVPGKWEDCLEAEYAGKVMAAYWKRYCPDAVAHNRWQTMARIHNGGPKGDKIQATKRYWSEVSKVMQEIKGKKPIDWGKIKSGRQLTDTQ